MKIAKRKVWRTADGKRLVEEGDPDAAVLFAGEGAQVPDSWLDGVKGGDDFFKDASPVKEPVGTTPPHIRQLKPGFSNATAAREKQSTKQETKTETKSSVKIRKAKKSK